MPHELLNQVQIPVGHTKEEEVVGKQKIGEWAKKAVQSRRNDDREGEMTGKPDGKLME